MVQPIGLHLPIHGVQIPSLHGELTSHKVYGQKPKTKQKKYYNKFNKELKKKRVVKVERTHSDKPINSATVFYMISYGFCYWRVAQKLNLL